MRASGCLLTVLVLSSAGLPAAAATADCFMSVGGRIILDGPCRFESFPGGSFTMGNDAYFAQVNVEKNGAAEGFWNEEKGATHAHTRLGDLTRKGGCWENRSARLCAWKLGSRPK